MDTRKRRAVFIYPHQLYPSYQRELAMMLADGFDVTVYAFERDVGSYVVLPEQVRIHMLGHIKSGHYLRRILALIRAAWLICKFERAYDAPASIVFGHMFDCALLGLLILSKNTVFVYKVVDLISVQFGRSILSKIMNLFERLIIKYSDVMSITSPAFLNYYSNLCSDVAKKSLVLENLLPKYFNNDVKRPNTVRVPGSPLRLGFIGFYRYESSILPLIEAVAKNEGLYEFHMFGVVSDGDKVHDLICSSSNVYYHGPYGIFDLPDIYRRIDVNCAIYDNADNNVKLALPNKLYESLYFGVPLIVSSGTYLSDLVLQYKAGFVCDPKDVNYGELFLKSLTVESILCASQNALLCPTERLIYNDDILRTALIARGLQ